LLPAALVRIVIPAGKIIPPPRPWNTRKAISDPADQASPESAEPAMNSAMASMYTRFVPNLSLAQPVSGITVAKASR
jgi:hypothetical protein